jgi:ribonucleoside-diphosphate reductase alpha chain
VFAYSYTRKIRNADGSTREEQVEDYAMRVWREVRGEAEPPGDLFVSAQTLTPSDHLTMQAAAQALIDSSISKTVNCPEDIGFNAFADIYVEGYHLGCKGLTTYRPNAVTGSILSTGAPTSEMQVEPVLQPRAEALHGTTYKLKWPESAHAVYLTINDVEQGGRRRPFEIFINSKNMEHYAWTVGLTRMISAVFRRTSDVDFVAEELKAVFDPRGGAWMQGKYVPSLLAAIGNVVERHLSGLGDSPVEASAFESASTGTSVLPQCPQCGSASLVKVEGCNNCLSCGYSKCG